MEFYLTCRRGSVIVTGVGPSEAHTNERHREGFGGSVAPRWLIVLFCIIATSSSGCGTYGRRVSDDFRDTFKLNVGVGLGLYAHAKATSYLDAGIGWGGYWENVGVESRYTDFVHPSIIGCVFPIGAIPGGLPHDSPITALRMANVRDTQLTGDGGEYAVVGQLFDATAIRKWDAYGPEKRSPHIVFHSADPTYTDHPLGFEAGVGLIVVNVSAGFDPVEFCDLVCAIFGFDLLRDTAPKKAATQPSSRNSG